MLIFTSQLLPWEFQRHEYKLASNTRSRAPTSICRTANNAMYENNTLSTASWLKVLKLNEINASNYILQTEDSKVINLLPASHTMPIN